jgi:hypothetical protein
MGLIKVKITIHNSNISGEIYEKYIHLEVNYSVSGNYR